MGGALAGHFSARTDYAFCHGSYDAAAHFIVPCYYFPATPAITYIDVPLLLHNLKHLSIITTVFDAADTLLNIAALLHFDATRRPPPRRGIKIRTAVSPFRVVEPGSTGSNNYIACRFNSRCCDASSTGEDK